MSMEMCMCCNDPSTLVDTDYIPEIYRYGFEGSYTIAEGWSWEWTGNQNEAVAFCDECLRSELDKVGLTEEWYIHNYM